MTTSQKKAKNKEEQIYFAKTNEKGELIPDLSSPAMQEEPAPLNNEGFFDTSKVNLSIPNLNDVFVQPPPDAIDTLPGLKEEQPEPYDYDWSQVFRGPASQGVEEELDRQYFKKIHDNADSYKKVYAKLYPDMADNIMQATPEQLQQVATIIREEGRGREAEQLRSRMALEEAVTKDPARYRQAIDKMLEVFSNRGVSLPPEMVASIKEASDEELASISTALMKAAYKQDLITGASGIDITKVFPSNYKDFNEYAMWAKGDIGEWPTPQPISPQETSAAKRLRADKKETLQDRIALGVNNTRFVIEQHYGASEARWFDSLSLQQKVEVSEKFSRMHGMSPHTLRRGSYDKRLNELDKVEAEALHEKIKELRSKGMDLA